MIKKILGFIFFGLMIAAFAYSLKIGLDRSERAECLEWRDQAAQFPLWYSTEWQREQCIAHGLPLPR